MVRSAYYEKIEGSWGPDLVGDNGDPAGYERKRINPIPKYCSLGELVMGSLKTCLTRAYTGLGESDRPRES